MTESIKVTDSYGHSIYIPESEHEKMIKFCESCKTRKWYAKFVDAHIDFMDCPYDCKNDIDHYRKKHPENVRYE